MSLRGIVATGLRVLVAGDETSGEPCHEDRWPTSMVSADKLAIMRATGLTGSLGLRPAAATTTLLAAKAMPSSSAVCWTRSLPLWIVRSGRHWAIVASLVATAKLNGVEPLAWLTDLLERMISGRTKVNELERLLPWSWKAERLAAAVHA